MDDPITWESEKDMMAVKEHDRVLNARPTTGRRYLQLALWVAVTDAVALEAAIILTWLLRSDFRDRLANPAGWLVVAPIVWVAIFAMFRLYSLSRMPAVEEFRRVLEASFLALVVKLGHTFLFDRPDLLSTGWIWLTWAVAVVLVLAGREVWHRYMARLRKRGDLSWRTLIVGANTEAVKIGESLQRRASGFLPVGLVRTDHGWASWDGIPELGELGELSQLIEEYGIECVFVASSAVGPDQMKHITRHLGRSGVEVRVSANMTDILSSRLTMQPVGNLLALCLRPVRLSGSQAAIKRGFDVLVASMALVLIAPVWVAVSLMIKLTSRGPVLYKQERIGQNGEPFIIYKFRTMVQGADLRLAEVADRNEASGPLFKVRNDPRVTTVGRWLRRWSLDELPQLLNVLRGDMSLVGPRPPLPNEVAMYEDWHHDRLQVRPGITGVWQVGGRSDLGFDDYVRLDLFYIENWSLTYDLYVLAKTVPAVLFRRGAY